MATTWTRIHERVGAQPGPLTVEMIKRAAEHDPEETDDLDWKEQLPDTRNPNTPDEFAKDVAAMANTRGGIIVFGVSDDGEYVGIDPKAANEDQYAAWLRDRIQPYLAGVDMYPLESDEGRLFIVDVPASDLAPHSAPFIHKDQKTKEQRATVTPYRDGPHTAWMAEHQIARAYQDRFARLSRREEQFNEAVKHAAGLLTDTAPGHAWLIIAALPNRPAPLLGPRLAPDETKRLLLDVADAPLVNPISAAATQVLKGIRNGDLLPQIGLNCWTTSNLGFDSARKIYVETHHDGSFVLGVNLTEKTDLRHEEILDDLAMATAGKVIVNCDAVERAAADAVSATVALLRNRHIDSTVGIVAEILKGSEQGRFVCAVPADIGGFTLADGARQLPRVRRVASELPPVADQTVATEVAAQLAAGLLNQFGLEPKILRP